MARILPLAEQAPSPQRLRPSDDLLRLVTDAGSIRRGTDGAALPQIVDDRLERAVVALAEREGGGDTIIYFSGPVVVQGAGKNGAQVADEIVAALKRKAMARTGTPDDWSKS